eukprot:SAG11_NODE_8569_length_1000_cov_0.881243_1_plen_112_part_01
MRVVGTLADLENALELVDMVLPLEDWPAATPGTNRRGGAPQRTHPTQRRPPPTAQLRRGGADLPSMSSARMQPALHMSTACVIPPRSKAPGAKYVQAKDVNGQLSAVPAQQV